MTNSSALLEQLKNSDAAVRRKAIRALASYPQEMPVVEAICEALGDPNKGVQNISIDVLSSMRHVNVVKGLIPAVRSSDLNTRNAGMTVLRNLGSIAIEPLAEALHASKDVDEIIQLLVILGDIRSPLSTQDVIKYINHADDNVKTTAVESLGKIQDPSAVPTLIETYASSDILKYSIVEALGNIAVDEAMPVVLGALDSLDILEYFTAIGALGALESPKCAEPLLKKLLTEEDSGTKRLIFTSLAQIEKANPGVLKTLELSSAKPILLSLLDNRDSAEFKQMLRVAAAVEDEMFVQTLIAALGSPDEEIVALAFDGLHKLGQKTLKPALEAVVRAEPKVAVKLLKLFTTMTSPLIPPVLASLKNHSNDSVRQALAPALAKNPSNDSFNALREMTNDVDEIVRRNAVIGLSGMLDYDGALTALINKFKDINGHVRREACSAFFNSSSPQLVEPLFGVVQNEPYGDVREAAASVLASRKDAAITKRLLELLDGNNSRLRETISRTIWQCGSTLAVDSLIQKLSDKEWRIVVNSCYSLEKMKDLKSIFPLKELLKHSDWQIRIAALSALRAFKSKELKQFFIPLLSDENPQVAKLAVVALSEIGDKSLDNDLKKQIKHPHWQVRYQIVKALGAIKSQSSADTLVHVAEHDESNAVKARAILALAKIKCEAAAPAIFDMLDNEDKNIVVAALKYFKDMGTSGIEGFENKLKSIFLHNAWVKNYFIEAAAQNNSETIEKVLKSVISPRQKRLYDRLKAQKDDEKGMNTEEALVLREIVAEKCGIEIADKRTLEAKLARNLSRFFITSWIEYYHTLRYGTEEGSDVLIALYDSITNPATSFFAEASQNKVLAETLIPEMIENRLKKGEDTVRILCIGSSFGPEAYSMAMTVLEDVRPDRAKVEIVGTDISHICLNTAKRGIYKREMFRTVDQKYIDVYFEDDRGDMRVKDEVKNLVEFKFANAVNSDALDQLGEFDIVICRNLFSDFSQEAKERMAENVYNILAPGGMLLIGHNESLYNVTKAFRLQTYENVVGYKKM